MVDNVMGVGAGLALGFLACAVSCERSEDGCPWVDTRAGCTADCGAPGSLLWERTFQGGSSGRVAALTVDACGSLIAAGEVRPSRDAASEGIWAATYHADGELAWSVADRLTHGATGSAVALHDDQIYVGGEAIIAGAGLVDDQRRPVVRVYSAQGEGIQTHVLGLDRDHVEEFATDAQGGLLALTRLGRVWRVPPQGGPVETFIPAEFISLGAAAASPDGRRALVGAALGGSSPGLLLMYDSTGAEAWRAGLDVYPLHIGFDSEGTLVIVEGPDDETVTVRRYSVSGEPMGVESIRLPSEVSVSASTVDHRGRVLVGGRSGDNQESREPWVARLSATGLEWSWTRPGLPGDARVTTLAVDAVGAVFVGASVDVSELSGMIGDDIWMGRLAP